MKHLKLAGIKSRLTKRPTLVLAVIDITLFLTLIASLLFTNSVNLLSLRTAASNNGPIEQELKEQILTRMTKCAKSGQRSNCLHKVAADFLQIAPLGQILEAVNEKETQEEIFNTCHQTFHYLGRIAYQSSKNIQKMFNQCTHSCLDGCYHGAVEGYFIEKGINLTDENFPIIAQEVAKICGRESDYQTPELYVTCLHGLGHATMFIADYDLLQALKLCDSLVLEGERELCYTGSLMANADSFEQDDHPSKYIKADDPMYPCPILPRQYQKECYEYNTLNFYHFTNYNWEQTIKLCGQVPQAYRRGCYQTMGGDQVGFTDDMVKIKNACAQIADEEFVSACIDGAEGNLVMRYSDDFIKPIKFCSLWDGNFKDKCYNTFVSLLNRWSREQNKKIPICRKIEEGSYQEKCLKKVG